MPKWTNEQLDAINKSGTNIIVSAGAGSGKTAVLSERVLRILKEGTHIDELLILTFTNAAAKEMKERIRKKIKENPLLIEELDLIDSAYITTFDSFALSTLKKYHYLLNISPNVSIIDESIINIEKNKIIEDIFEEYYNKEDKKFINLITTFCTKDDEIIKKAILEISKKLDLKTDKENYIKEYINNYFNEEKIDNDIKEYEELIKNKIKEINNIIEELSLELDGSYIEKLNDSLINLLNSNSYNDIKTNLEIKLPTLPKGSSDNVKQLKENINKIIKELKSLTQYSLEEIKENILSTKDYVEVILEIIEKLDKKINEYKFKYDVYEFNDIAKLSIKIIKENKEIREELKNKFKEILVDEYQDTSDIQEEFINLIENNNVYMVGDIKQSIYRFRNANPLIFKEKYHTLQVTPPNMVIDLSQNFRSRKEVLDAVNLIFSALMGAEIGGVDYNYAHELHFGFSKYEDYNEENNQMQILTYPFERKTKSSVNSDDISEDEEDENEEQTQTFTKDEIEAFIIGKDILSKVNKYKVYHKDIDTYGPATYKDFAILVMDKKKMQIYAKVFEYLGLPLKVHEDIILTNNNDIFAIISLLRLIYIFYNNKQASKQELKEVLLSFLRSFIVNLPDDEIFQIITDANVDEMFKKTLPDLYQKCQQIASQINELNLSNILTLIFKEFSVYEKMLTLSDVASSEYNLNYLFQICESLTSLNYSFKEMIDYLNLLVNDSKFEIKIPIPTSNNNDVINMMTIHASKGLEFPICYFPELYKKFNFEDLKRDIFYSKDYQIIASVLKDRLLYKPLTYFLEKENFLKAEVSEKIRLFYVALTRPREQIIMVMPTSESDKPKSTSDIAKMGIKSFKDMLLCLNDIIEPYKHPIDINSLGLTKEYLYPKKQQNLHLDNEQILSFCNITLKNHTTLSMRASASVVKYHTKEDLDKMNEGTRIHKILELLDLTNPDLEKLLPKDQKLIKGFINHPFIKSLNIINHYHEYHFITTQDEVQINGIIDLIIETEESYYIIDYKLYDTNKEEYTKQLNIYKNYLSNIVNKPVYSYLYSIIKNDFTKV